MLLETLFKRAILSPCILEFFLGWGVLLLFFFFFGPSCRIFVPGPGIEPMPPAVEAQNLNHCREVPKPLHFGWLLYSIEASQVTQW